MAYTRESYQELEVDFSLEAIWNAIPEAVARLKWEIPEKDDANHRLTIRTAEDFMFYGSSLKVEASKIDVKTTYIKIVAETPVTTITSLLDYGQAEERITEFVMMLAKIMNSPEKTVAP